MKKLKLIVTCFVTILYSYLGAQEVSGGKPYTFKRNTHHPNASRYVALADTIATTVLPAYTNAYLKNYADSATAGRGVAAYGRSIRISVDIIANGTHQLINGINVYRYRVRSDHAIGLQFFFNDYTLPQGGRLFLYSYDKKTLYGALTHRNNPGVPGEGFQMSTPPMPGNDWILEYNVRASGPQGKLILGSVVHVFH